MIELETFESEEFEEALRELREAEKCEPCDPDCEYAPLCRYIRATNDE